MNLSDGWLMADLMAEMELSLIVYSPNRFNSNPILVKVEPKIESVWIGWDKYRYPERRREYKMTSGSYVLIIN